MLQPFWLAEALPVLLGDASVWPYQRLALRQRRWHCGTSTALHSGRPGLSIGLVGQTTTVTGVAASSCGLPEALRLLVIRSRLQAACGPACSYPSLSGCNECSMATGRRSREVCGAVTYPFTLIRNGKRLAGICYEDFFDFFIRSNISATSISALPPAWSAYASL